MPLKHSVEEIILKNGARGLLIDTPNATAVHYDIQFRAGNHYAPSNDISQVPHIMEHMAFGPNERYETLDAFSREFRKNGAYNNAWTGSIDMVYNAHAGVMEWQRILDLQLLAITKPVFSEKLLKAEKGNVREEITGYANDHSRILWQVMMRRAGLKRWFDEDELKTIDAVTLGDIKQHHLKTHTTGNMRFILAGDLKKHREEIIEIFESIALPFGKQLPLSVDSLHNSGPVFIHRKDLPSLSFSISFFLDRQVTRKESQAIRILNDVITGSFHSRIWGEARVRGICYDMGSGLDIEPTKSSTWSIAGQVSPVNATELFELIAVELLKISKESITESELQETKSVIKGSIEMGSETVRSLASWYGGEYYDNNVISYISDSPAIIDSVTTEDIRKLLNEFLQSKAWSFGGIGDIQASDFEIHYKELANRLNKVE